MTVRLGQKESQLLQEGGTFGRNKRSVEVQWQKASLQENCRSTQQPAWEKGASEQWNMKEDHQRESYRKYVPVPCSF